MNSFYTADELPDAKCYFDSPSFLGYVQHVQKVFVRKGVVTIASLHRALGKKANRRWTCDALERLDVIDADAIPPQHLQDERPDGGRSRLQHQDMTKKERVCLDCTLFECNEKDPGCRLTNPKGYDAFRIRHDKRLAPLLEKAEQREDRSEYYRQHYLENRPRILEAARIRWANKNKRAKQLPPYEGRTVNVTGIEAIGEPKPFIEEVI